jgi:HD-GYP domain-containing protein (c-di-GMP phosphodiesterase class II)
VVALNNLANLQLSSKVWTVAQKLFEQALDLSKKYGLKQCEIDNLDGLGQVYVTQGNHEEAMRIHFESITLARDIGDLEGEIEGLQNFGRACLAVKQPHLAVDVLTRALELSQRLEYRTSLRDTHELLSRAYEETGKLAKALEHHRLFHALEKALFNEEGDYKTRQLALRFDLERAQHEAEVYRLRTELAQQAREEAESKVRERTRELEEAQLEIVARLAQAGEYRDDDTGEHTKRVGHTAAMLAYALGWPEHEVQLLYYAARLHDVGKIGIRDAILLKPGKLNPEEMQLMQLHTTMGARILSSGRSPLLQMAEAIAYSHHERWDGTGYPRGLAGQEIPQAARIVSVADVLDALTHERPYKRAWLVTEALEELKRQRGKQFDPEAVDVCLEVFGKNGGRSPSQIPSDWQSTLQALRLTPSKKRS